MELGAFSDLVGFQNRRNVDNEVYILQSHRLMSEVVKRLHLTVNYSVRDGLRTLDLYGRSPIEVDFIDDDNQRLSLEVTELEDGRIKLADFDDKYLTKQEKRRVIRAQYGDTIPTPLGTWKIMPLLRPFALLLVIMFWGGYCDLVRWPAAQLEGTAYAQIYAKNQEIGQLASERWEQIDILTGRIYTKAAMVDNAMDSWQNEDFLQALISSMSVTDYNELSQKLIAGGSWVFKAFLWGFTLIIEKLGLIFLQFSIVLIIMMQTLFMSILYIIGPLSFGFSVLGVWRSSWSAWTARYLSVTFYSVILFVALSVIYTILGYTLEREIQYLTDLVAKTEDPLKDWDEFYEYAGAMTGQACMFVVCIMAACGATMYVPVCSSWIIETSGTAPAATGVTAGVGIVTMGASSVVRAGGSVIKGMGSTIGGGQS